MRPHWRTQFREYWAPVVAGIVAVATLGLLTINASARWAVLAAAGAAALSFIVGLFALQTSRANERAYRIFISSVQANDKDFDTLRKALQRAGKVEISDPSKFTLGKNLLEELDEQIRISNMLIVLIGGMIPSAMPSEVNREVHDAQQLAIPIVPVRIRHEKGEDKDPSSNAEELPEPLKDLVGMVIRDDRDYDRAARRLVESLKSGRSSSDAPEPPE
jgi:hypothetical protein